MSSPLRILALILGGICLAAVVVVVFLLWGFASIQREMEKTFQNISGPGDEKPLVIADQPRLYFLKDIDFDGGPVRLILESSLTGGASLLVDDQALLRQVAGTASIPDLRISGRGSLLGLLFSERMRERELALRVERGGFGLSSAYCLPQLCRDDPETRQSLAPLVAGASARVVAHRDSFTDYDAYAAAFAQARAVPGRLTELPNSPSPRTERPVSYRICLPALIQSPSNPGAAEIRAALDDLDAAISAALIDRQGHDGMIILEAREQAPGVTLHDNCDPRKPQLARLDDAAVTTLEVRGFTDEQGYARLAAIADWSFLPQPPAPDLPDDIAARLSAGDLAPECVTIWAPDGPPVLGPITLSPPKYREYSLTWEEAVPLER